MAEKHTIQITVSDPKMIHIERKPILSVEDAKTGTFHKDEGFNADAVQSLINSLKKNPTNMKFRIVWEPPEGDENLMNGLKGAKKILTIRIYWVIRNDTTVIFARTATFEGGKVNKPTKKIGRAGQEIEFTATSLSAPQ
ncbi:MAG: hypothetical protein ACRD6X_22420 [Pyrinomonadaceae bacterium]